MIAEADAITEATGSAPLWYTSLVLAAWRGQEDRALELIQLGSGDATARGEGRAIALAHYVTAVLYNGLGRYEDAFAAAERACAYEDLGLFGWALVELVEAGARSDHREVALDAVLRLDERTRAAGTDWALGILARSRALVSDGDAPEALYRDAIERLGQTRIAVHHARTQLLYGEWLRRENRRADARHQLHAAHQTFSPVGAQAFADRARRELLATGKTVRKRTVETLDELTAQEAQVARLAAQGRTNPEIGARLFVSLAPSSTTCTRSSPSSRSPPARSYALHCPSAAAKRCRSSERSRPDRSSGLSARAGKAGVPTGELHGGDGCPQTPP